MRSNPTDHSAQKHHTTVPAKVGTVLIVGAYMAVTALVACLLSGCTDRMPSYSAFRSVSPRGWAPDDEKVFEPWPSDSARTATERYEVRMCLRYHVPSVEEARLVVETESLSGSARTDTVCLPLLHDGGRPAGKGAHGLFSLEHTLDTGLRLPEGYTLSIHPADTLRSLSEIGIILLPI